MTISVSQTQAAAITQTYILREVIGQKFSTQAYFIGRKFINEINEALDVTSIMEKLDWDMDKMENIEINSYNRAFHDVQDLNPNIPEHILNNPDAQLVMIYNQTISLLQQYADEIKDFDLKSSIMALHLCVQHIYEMISKRINNED